MRLLQSLVLMVVSLLVATIGAELFLRAAHLAQPGAGVTVTDADFQRLPGVLAPRRTVVDRRIQSLAHLVTTDSLGYRGSDFARAKPPGEYRVFLTGDSFTYGDFVDDSVTIPVLVDRALKGSCPAIRVINGGLRGSSITEQDELARRALVLEPDLVLVMFYDNDIAALASEPLWTQMAEDRQWKSTFPMSVAYAILRDSHLWTLVRSAREELKPAGRDPPTELSDVPHLAPERLRYVQLLAALRDSLAVRSVPLGFIVMPPYQVVAGSASDAGIREVARGARSARIPVLELLDPFHESGVPVASLYHVPVDPHTSVAGNRVAAAAITAWLRHDPFTACPDDESH